MTRKALNDLTNYSTNVNKANMLLSPIMKRKHTSVARGASDKANMLATLDKLNASVKSTEARVKNLKTKKDAAIRNAKRLLALGKKPEASRVYKQIKLLDEQLLHVKHMHDTLKRQIDVIAGRQQRHSPPAPTFPSVPKHSPSMPRHSPSMPTFPSVPKNSPSMSPPVTPMSKEERAVHDRLKKLKRGLPKHVHLTAEEWKARMCTNAAAGKNACVCEFLEWLLYKCEKTGCANVARKFEEKVVREQADIDQLYKFARSFQKSKFVSGMKCLN